MAGSWTELPYDVQAKLLRMKSTGGVGFAHFGPHLEELIGCGFLEPYAKLERVRLGSEWKRSFSLLRALDYLSQWIGTDEEQAEAYVHECFTINECEGMMQVSALRHSARRRSRRSVVLTSQRRLQGFLDSDDLAGWEREQLPALKPWERKNERLTLLADEQAAEDCRRLVRALSLSKEPIGLVDIDDLFDHRDFERVGAAIQAAIRYALAVPSLDPVDNSPLLGLWPSLADRIHREAVSLPPVLESTEFESSFDVAWGLEDLTQLLVAVADPIRLRGSDKRLFAKAQRELEDGLLSLPKLGGEDLDMRLSPERRVSVARRTAERAGWTELRGQEGKSLSLALTDLGREWLAKPAKERLRTLIDIVLPETCEGSAAPELRVSAYGSLVEPELYVPQRYFSGRELNDLGVNAAVRRTLEPLGEGPRALGAFMISCQRSGLPAKLQRIWSASFESWSLQGMGDSDWEACWFECFARFFVERLWCFGGLRFWLREGGEPAAELTDAGRYLLGLASDFEYGANEADRPVRVQPDFEVVFLAPAPTFEAAYSRFAERIGSHVGALFRITRASIHAASNAGLSAADVLREVEASLQSAPPANVVHEIEGWFAECVRLELQHALILRCPSAEVATRVLAVAGRYIEAATETLLILKDAKKRAEVLKLCRRAGLFIEGGEPVTAPRAKKKRMSRRHYW